MKKVPAFLPDNKALEALTLDERKQYFNSIFETKPGEQAAVPQDIAKKLKIETDRINKDKKVTFRVTTDIYEQLETISNANDLTMSRLMEAITKEHLQMLNIEYALAGFINTFAEDNLKQRLVDAESVLPAEFRLYSKLIKKYPDAVPINGLKEIIEKMEEIKEIEQSIIKKKTEEEESN